MNEKEQDRGTTAFELLKKQLRGEKERPQEFKIFNPLQVKIGDLMLIDLIDPINEVNLGGINFTVIEIDAYERRVGEKIYEFTDYVLKGDGEQWVTLRVNPIKDADPDSKDHCEMLILFPHRELGYNETDEGRKNLGDKLVEEILPSGILEVLDEKGKVMASYSRCHGLEEPYTVELLAVKKGDAEISKEYLVYWDFEREVSGNVEYYFVEMNKETGWFQTFRGLPVPEQDVVILPKAKT